MPFKQHSKGRRHIPRQRHRVTNWRDYDAALRNRGSLTVWFSEEALAQRHLLFLIDVGALILIVVLQLLAAELVRLPVIKRQAKQIELSVFVNLELHEATRPWALVFHHRGKPAGGHQLSREYVAIPWIQL